MQEKSNIDYIVTARRWRPQRFASMVGQDHITTTLRNALASGRIHHAYLFCGPRGVGKTTTARLLARAVNCSNPIEGIEPCNECQSCMEILSGRSIDVIEIDGASNNSVEDVRRLRENVKYPPTTGRYKVYIIDEVHMLSISAFNALLKTLEEPPAHLMFIFATTEPYKVPPTIQSRCQRFDFHRMDTHTIASHLRMIASVEGVTVDDDALFTIARFADGSMRDAQSLFDQARAFTNGNITGAAIRESLHILGEDFYFAVTDAIKERNLARAFDLASSILAQGYDVHQTLIGLLEHLRNILTVTATGTSDLIDASSDIQRQYLQEATRWSADDLVQMITFIATTEQNLRYAPQPRLRLELLLAQLVRLPSARDIRQLIEQLDNLTAPDPTSQHTASTFPGVAQSRVPTSSIEKPQQIPPPHLSSTEKLPESSPVQSVRASTDTQPDWREVVETLPKFFDRFKSVLAQCQVTFESNACLLTCDDVTVEFLRTYQSKLERVLSQRMGKQIQLQFISTPQRNHSSTPVQIPDSKGNDERTPLERELMEKLGAQRLPLLG